MKFEEAKESLEKLVNITNVDSNTYVNLEDTHIDADNILCSVINEYVPNGKELTKLFRKIDKWYA